MTRFIVITGGKGGVGKTTTAVSLGCALSSLGKDVTVLDANLTTPNVGIYLGSPVVPVHLHHVLQGKNHISEAIYMHPSGTKIVPAGIGVDDMRKTNPMKLKQAIAGLRGLSDFVLVDSAAGLGRETMLAIESCSEVLIVTNAEMSAIADALKTIRVVQGMHKKILGVVVTRHRGKKDEVPIENVESLLEHKVIGIIPESEDVKESHALRDNVLFTHPKSKVSRRYRELAGKLSGVKVEAEEPESVVFDPKESRFAKFLRVMGIH